MYLWPRITHTFVNNPRVLINFEKFSALYFTDIDTFWMSCLTIFIWSWSRAASCFTASSSLITLQQYILLHATCTGIEIFDKNIKICTCIFQLFRKKENSAIIGVLFFLQFFTSWKLSLQFIGHACVCITYILDVTILKF